MTYQKVASLIISTILMISIISFTLYSDKAEARQDDEPDKYTIWLFSDIQENPVAGNEGQLDHVIPDVNNMTENQSFIWDIALVLGDMGTKSFAPSVRSQCQAAYTYYYQWIGNLTLHNRSYIFEIGGNHDVDDRNDDSGCPTADSCKYFWAMNRSWDGGTTYHFNVSDRGWYPPNVTMNGTTTGLNYNYTLDIHNLLFVMFTGNDYGSCNPHNEAKLEGDRATWFNSTIDNNPNKLVMFGNHYGIDNNGNNKGQLGLPSMGYSGYDTWTLNPWMEAKLNQSNACGYFFGHTHCDNQSHTVAINNGTFYMEVASTSAYKSTPKVDLWDNHAVSTFITFTDDSDKMHVRYRDHNLEQWVRFNVDGNDIYPSTGMNFTLPFAFEMDEIGDEITISSINSVANDSSLNVAHRHLNWTKVSGAIYYNLQISNDATFTDIFYNATDINAANYAASYYNQRPNHINFNITNIYSQGAVRGGTHYYRVRAYR